jgi:hypothetical protein
VQIQNVLYTRVLIIVKPAHETLLKLDSYRRVYCATLQRLDRCVFFLAARVRCCCFFSRAWEIKLCRTTERSSALFWCWRMPCRALWVFLRCAQSLKVDIRTYPSVLCGSCGIFECDASTRSEDDHCEYARADAERPAESPDPNGRDSNSNPARKLTCDSPTSDNDSDNPLETSDLDPWDPSPELHVPDSSSALDPDSSSLQPGPERPVLYVWAAPLAEQVEAAGHLTRDACSSPMSDGVLPDGLSPATLF